MVDVPREREKDLKQFVAKFHKLCLEYNVGIHVTRVHDYELQTDDSLRAVQMNVPCDGGRKRLSGCEVAGRYIAEKN